jgi:hypothetical protein
MQIISELGVPEDKERRDFSVVRGSIRTKRDRVDAHVLHDFYYVLAQCDARRQYGGSTNITRERRDFSVVVRGTIDEIRATYLLVFLASLAGSPHLRRDTHVLLLVPQS